MRLAAVVAAAVLMSGCAAMDYKQGTLIQDSDYAALKEGQTTQAQVASTYGPPQQTIPDGANTTYVYRYSVIGSMPIIRKNSSQSTSLTFNSKGVLIAKAQHSSDTAGGNPLTQ
jgi:outer membrane protein assembly factor BamE (lipoprotein component of BamABCDE complex)